MRLEFLLQYIEDSSDAELNARVDAWLSEDANNPKYLDKVKKVWSNIDELKALAAIDVDADWALIEQRISAKNRPMSPVVGRQISWWNNPRVKVAASFLIMVIAGGLIWYFSGTRNNNPELAANYYEFNVPLGQKSSLVMPDGTKIIVNAGSKLLLPQDPKNSKREIWLDGEAFFQVTKNPSSPFYVHTPNMQVKVLGTTFNVRAYDDEHLVETTLVEGKVNLKNLSGKDEELTLEPNHKAILVLDKDVRLSSSVASEFGPSIKLGSLQLSKEVDPQMAISWTQDKLVFKEESLEFIAEQLERFYGAKIHIGDQALKRNKYSGTIKNISLEQTLKALQLISDFNFVIKEEDVYISQ